MLLSEYADYPNACDEIAKMIDEGTKARRKEGSTKGILFQTASYMRQKQIDIVPKKDYNNGECTGTEMWQPVICLGRMTSLSS